METGKNPVGLPVVSELTPAGVSEVAVVIPADIGEVPPEAWEFVEVSGQYVRIPVATEPEEAAVKSGSSIWTEEQRVLAERLGNDRTVMNIAVSMAWRYPTGEAEDLFQETIMRLARNADKIDHNDGSIYGLVHRTMDWICIDAGRQVSDTVPDPDDEGHRLPRFIPTEPENMADQAAPATTEEIIERKLLREDVALALSKLSAKHRQAIHYAYLRGWNLSEVAVFLNTKQGTIKSRLHYGLQKLGELLDESYRVNS